MFGQDRSQLRKMFFEAWRKSTAGEPLTPLEQEISRVAAEHPEYHALLQSAERHLARDYLPEAGETNPFLHMAMHLSIREQLATQRPAGIMEAYRDLVGRLGEPHEAEHRMMECLGEMLWQAQRDNLPPSESAYLGCLRKLTS
ncbi:MAG: DUF1841 family protein [Pseudomonadota bacterium]|nr:MAG: DUF1841 family protein [Pseudomonadota bacterium]